MVGDAILVDRYGPHFAVVLRVTEMAALIACGTSQKRPDRDEVIVKPRSPAAVVIGLTAVTYFVASGVGVLVDPAEIIRPATGRRCPPGVFHAIEDMAARALKDTPCEEADRLMAPLRAALDRSRTNRK